LNLPTIIIHLPPGNSSHPDHTCSKHYRSFCPERRDIERSPARHGFVSVGIQKGGVCRVESWEKGDIYKEGFQTVPEDAGIEPGTVATLTLAVRRSDQSARPDP
jgi:hypothetical protein